MALKQLEYHYIPVQLVKNGGMQHDSGYSALNPAQLVPTLIDDSQNLTLTQSLAIIEYLEQQYPQKILLLPESAGLKAKVRAMAQDIACDIQPLANLRVIQYLQNKFEATAERQKQWSVDWITRGLNTIEQRLYSCAATYCFGEHLTLADVCLIPQVYNARRFSIDLCAFPLIERIEHNCSKLAAFEGARPENQMDAE